MLDFGLAKVRSERPADGALTHDGQMLGTPHYIAPEQISDARRADIRADIYSLGCTLYYLLTGGPPFQGTSLYDILQAHHSMDATPLNLKRPEVPIELAALVAKMMAKEPERRFQEPKDVGQALTPFFKSGAGSFKSPSAQSPMTGQTGICRMPGVVSTSTQPAEERRRTDDTAQENGGAVGTGGRVEEPDRLAGRRNARESRRRPSGQRGGPGGCGPQSASDCCSSVSLLRGAWLLRSGHRTE